MTALVGDLDAVLQRRRRSLAGAAIGISLTGVIGITAGYQAAASEQLDPCENAGTVITDTWNDSRASEVEAAAAQADQSERFDALSETLDDYAAQWSDKRTEVCRATQVDGDQSDDAMQLRMVCLDRAQNRLGAIVDELAEQPTEQGLRVAPKLLAPLEWCDDLELLTAREDALEATDNSSIKQLEVFARGYRLDVQIIMRKHLGVAAWSPAADELARLGEDNDVAELRALGRMYRGDAFLADRKGPEALAEFQAALGDAVISDDWLVPELMNRAAEASMASQNLEAAKVYAANLRAFASQAQDKDRAFELGADVLEAKIAHAQGEFDPAREKLEQILPEVKQVAQDKPEFRIQLFGVRNLLAQTCLAMGDFPTAARELEAALEMAKQMPETPAEELAFRTAELGGAYARSGDWERGLKYATEAKHRMHKLFGDKHPVLAQVTSDIGWFNYELGNLIVARENLEAAVQIATDTVGPDSMEAVLPLEDLAKVARAEGKYDECVEMIERFRNVARKHLPPNDPLRSVPSKEAARCLLAKGDKETAFQTLQEALQVVSRDDIDPVMRGEVELLVAQSLAGSDDARAKTMAEAAVQRLPDHPGAAPLAEELSRLLASLES